MNDLVPVNNIENTRKNKGGRPRGSINKRTELVQNLLSKDIPKIISVVRKAALDGSLDAAALILRYITPTPRVRLRTCSRVAELSQHEADGGDFQEREAAGVEIFPVLGETAATVEPSNGALDDPPLG